jgi:hypothetical protein
MAARHHPVRDLEGRGRVLDEPEGVEHLMDQHARQLLRGGSELHLEPKAFDGDTIRLGRLLLVYRGSALRGSTRTEISRG